MGSVTLCNHQYDIWLWVSSLSEIPFCLPLYCGCSYLARTRINHSNSSWINSNRSIRNWETQQFGMSENGVYAVYAILTYTHYTPIPGYVTIGMNQWRVRTGPPGWSWLLSMFDVVRCWAMSNAQCPHITNGVPGMFELNILDEFIQVPLMINSNFI